MSTFRVAVVPVALVLLGGVTKGQPAPVPAPVPVVNAAPGSAPREVLKTLEEFPDEIVHEGVRLYDFELNPKPGSTVSAGTRVVLTFKYEVEDPTKAVFLGAMPLVDGKEVGGYQPFALGPDNRIRSEGEPAPPPQKSGKGEVGLILGGYGHSYGGGGPVEVSTLKTLDDLKKHYQQTDGLQFQVYGQLQEHLKLRAPLKYTVIPMSTYTLKDQFYLERLIHEVISLRKRVQDLEAAGQ